MSVFLYVKFSESCLREPFYKKVLLNTKLRTITAALFYVFIFFQQTPKASMDLATFIKPAIFAPATRMSGIPNSSAAAALLL